MTKIKARKYSDFNELFYRLTLQDKFQNSVQEARDKLNIPKEGLGESRLLESLVPRKKSNFKKVGNRWVRRAPLKGSSTSFEWVSITKADEIILRRNFFTKATDLAWKICDKYGLKTGDAWPVVVIKYILNNTWDTKLLDSSYGCRLLKRSGFKSDKEFVNAVGEDVVIKIYPQATKQDVFRFINSWWEEIETWKWIKREYWKYDKKTKQRTLTAEWREKPTEYYPKFKPSSKRELHEKIYEIYRAGHIYSSGVLKNKSWKEDFGIPHLNPDTVKKIILKQKRLHRGEG